MVRNRKETTEKSKKKPGLSTQMFIALLAGALLGVVIGSRPAISRTPSS